jgi:hypothetical protein
MIRLIFILFLVPAISAASTPFAVVELFTSESCASCPAADSVLSELKKEAEKKGSRVYFLEYHVDYWNRTGWRDPFSKNQFTLRQENYSRVLPGKEMYTPQFVINGSREVTSSGSVAVRAALSKEMRTPDFTIRLDSTSITNDTLVVYYSLDRADKNASVKVAVTEDHVTSEVKGGENKGKTLHHDGVVRLWYSTQSAERSGRVRIPLKGFLPKQGMKITLFVQQKQTLRIVAATQSSFE